MQSITGHILDIYWRSTGHILNFGRAYLLRRSLEEALKELTTTCADIAGSDCRHFLRHPRHSRHEYFVCVRVFTGVQRKTFSCAEEKVLECIATNIRV